MTTLGVVSNYVWWISELYFRVQQLDVEVCVSQLVLGLISRLVRILGDALALEADIRWWGSTEFLGH